MSSCSCGRWQHGLWEALTSLCCLKPAAHPVGTDEQKWGSRGSLQASEMDRASGLPAEASHLAWGGREPGEEEYRCQCCCLRPQGGKRPSNSVPQPSQCKRNTARPWASPVQPSLGLRLSQGMQPRALQAVGTPLNPSLVNQHLRKSHSHRLNAQINSKIQAYA